MNGHGGGADSKNTSIVHHFTYWCSLRLQVRALRGAYRHRLEQLICTMFAQFAVVSTNVMADAAAAAGADAGAAVAAFACDANLTVEYALEVVAATASYPIPLATSHRSS